MLLWKQNVLPIRYSYLSSLYDNNADIFAAAQLISYYNFSSMILSSIVMITLYISSNRFFPRRNGISNGRVVSSTKNKYGSAVNFL